MMKINHKYHFSIPNQPTTPSTINVKLKRLWHRRFLLFFFTVTLRAALCTLPSQQECDHRRTQCSFSEHSEECGTQIWESGSLEWCKESCISNHLFELLWKHHRHFCVWPIRNVNDSSVFQTETDLVCTDVLYKHSCFFFMLKHWS